MKSALLAALALAALVCSSSPSLAQGAATQDADALYLAKNYTAAIPAYQAILAADPKNAKAWYRLGVSFQSTGHFADARSDYNAALANGFPRFAVYYRLATLELQSGNKQAAVDNLSEAYTGLTIDPNQIRSDESLAPLTSFAPFATLLESLDRSFHPCKYDPRYRALDFWVGDWNVTSADGSQQFGANHIERKLGDCVIHESWTAGSGTTGESFTRYDASTGNWVQHWVDSVGSALDFVGTFDGKSVVMFAKMAGAKGHPALQRMSFTPLPDGRVRQLIEISKDAGAHWMPTFDGYYSKKGN